MAVALLAVGKYFDTFESLKSAVKEYEQKHFVQLCVEKSSKLETQISKSKTNTKLGCAKKDLLYSSIKYRCIHGGKFRSQGNGERKTQTFKIGCPFVLKINLSGDAQRLRVSEFVPTHNHDVSENLFKSLPRQRALDSEEKSAVQEMLSLRCNKKLIKQHIVTSMGKNVILKDIHNMGKQENNNLVETVEYLKSLGGYVEVVVTNEGKLEGIFFQDKRMKEAFKQNPELLLIDATYCLNNLYMPLYILMVINGNGQGQVAGLFLLSHETSENISVMLNIFKKVNIEASTNLQTVFTDKDFAERHAIREVFPAASLLLCFFHTLKTFRTKVTSEKMNLTNVERKKALAALEKIAYSKNEVEYEKNYNNLINLKCEKLNNYYNENWHEIRYEWVRGFMKTNKTFNVTTTNHLESLNNKIKQVVVKNSNLLDFFKDLVTCLESIHHEQKQKAINLVIKKATYFEEGSVEKFFHSKLTPFAWNQIAGEIESVKKMEFCFEASATIDSCGCIFFQNTTLPCRHILFKRKESGILATEEIIPKKYTRECLYNTFGNGAHPFGTPSTSTLVNLSSLPTPHPKRCLTKQEKFKKTMEVCNDIANVLSDYGTEKYYQALEKLKTLKTDLLQNNVLDNRMVEGDVGAEEADVGVEEADFGVEEADVGVEEADIGVEEADVGVEEADVGVEEADVGVEEADIGVEEADVGVEEADVGVEDIEVGVEEADVGVEDIEVGVEDIEVGVEEVDVGVEEVVVGFEEADIEVEEGDEALPQIAVLPGTQYMMEKVKVREGKLITLKDISLNGMSLKRKGRPKGADTTVVGLKRKRAK
ncbi:hypothetical protein M8J77_008516 [Diaphorina citri]|nr:hypothetical protein M8J77_008516 [Diaphorina citri]